MSRHFEKNQDRDQYGRMVGIGSAKKFGWLEGLLSNISE
jgi:hypothetical protein